VFYIDSDVAVLTDFREYFSPWDLNSYDLIIQNGSSVPSNGKTLNLCTGFMYLRASPLTLDFTNLEKYGSVFDKATGDQEYLHKFIKKWKYKQLPQSKFPNGRYLYLIIKTKQKLWEAQETTPYIVHMNFVIGGKNKLKKHEKFGTLFYHQKS